MNDKKLTDENIKKTKVGDVLWCKIVKGLHLRHRQTKKTFHLKYKVGNKQKRPWIQNYAPPHYTLSSAREEAKKHLAAVQLGQDPTAAKRSRIAAKTFRDLAHDYIDLYAKPNKKTWAKDQQMIDRDLLPAFKDTPLAEISRADIATVLNKIHKRAPVLANRTFEVTRKMFNWSVEQGLIDVSPCYLLKKPGTETKRDRVLSEHEIKAFWEWTESNEFAVASNNLGDTTKYIFQLVLLTGQRPGEVCQISKHQIDYDARVWTIPKSVHKSGRVHMVPLSNAVMSILDRVNEINSRSVRRSERPEYFLSPRKDASVLPNTLINKIRRRGDLLDIPHWTPHDLRRTAATNISGRVLDGDQKSKRFIVARVLGHTDKEVTGIYDRYEYLDEKKTALQGWADLVTSWVSF
jgi:integrase